MRRTIQGSGISRRVLLSALSALPVFIGLGLTSVMMLVLHDDPQREYAYGPAQGLPDTKVGTFPQPLYDEASKNGWSVISMKNDWKRIFAFE
jgi:hypothetical protein